MSIIVRGARHNGTGGPALVRDADGDAALVCGEGPGDLGPGVDIPATGVQDEHESLTGPDLGDAAAKLEGPALSSRPV